MYISKAVHDRVAAELETEIAFNRTQPQDRFCSERCFEAAHAGQMPYAPCPLLDSSRYTPEELCLHCGWFIRK